MTKRIAILCAALACAPLSLGNRVVNNTPAGGSPCTAVFTSGQADDAQDTLFAAWIAYQITSDGNYTDISQIEFRLIREGNPAGTLQYGIYANNAGVPGTQIGDWSAGINIATLNTTETAVALVISGDQPDLTAATVYWVVLRVTGFTTSAGNRLYVRKIGTGTNDTYTSSDGSSWSSGDLSMVPTVILYTGSCP